MSALIFTARRKMQGNPKASTRLKPSLMDVLHSSKETGNYWLCSKKCVFFHRVITCHKQQPSGEKSLMLVYYAIYCTTYRHHQVLMPCHKSAHSWFTTSLDHRNSAISTLHFLGLIQSYVWWLWMATFRFPCLDHLHLHPLAFHLLLGAIDRVDADVAGDERRLGAKDHGQEQRHHAAAGAKVQGTPTMGKIPRKPSFLPSNDRGYSRYRLLPIVSCHFCCKPILSNPGMQKCRGWTEKYLKTQGTDGEMLRDGWCMLMQNDSLRMVPYIIPHAAIAVLWKNMGEPCGLADADYPYNLCNRCSFASHNPFINATCHHLSRVQSWFFTTPNS